MKVIIADSQRIILVCKYMQEKIGIEFDPTQVQGFAVVADDGTFVGAVLVSNLRYSGDKAIDCEISCAAETSMAWRPNVCKAIFGYIFGQLGCVRCTSIVQKNNKRSREFLEALNFQLEGNLRKAYDGFKDALVYGLLAEECKFYGDLNEQEKRPESAPAARSDGDSASSRADEP